MAFELRGVNDHLARVLESVNPLAPIDVGLQDARGCILAEDVHAPWPLPPFDNSAMDGYAVIADSVAIASEQAPLRLQVIEDIPAGHAPRSTVVPGTAARIMTGAPLPLGADAVVPLEQTDGGMPVVAIGAPVTPGAYVRRAGDDVPAGALVLRAGSVVDARYAALAAAVGRGRVTVHPRPRVVVMTTGSELVEPGRSLGPGLINDANGPALAMAAAEIGAEVYRVGPIPDDPRMVADALHDQLVRADLIITTGGVSVGAYDTVKQVLSQMGSVEFVRVAMQPGMPQGFGHLGGVPIFTLPGNPVSAFVSFEVFVRPVLRKLLGYSELFRPTVEATVTADFTSPTGRRQYARGQLSASPEGYLFQPSAGQASHQVAVLAHATGLAIVPEDVTEVRAGMRLPVMSLASQR